MENEDRIMKMSEGASYTRNERQRGVISAARYSDATRERYQYAKRVCYCHRNARRHYRRVKSQRHGAGYIYACKPTGRCCPCQQTLQASSRSRLSLNRGWQAGRQPPEPAPPVGAALKGGRQKEGGSAQVTGRGGSAGGRQAQNWWRPGTRKVPAGGRHGVGREGNPELQTPWQVVKGGERCMGVGER